MNSPCKEINIVLNQLIKSGNVVKEYSEGWSNAKEVFAMTDKLNKDVKNKIELEFPNLEYWVEQGSPHNEPAEGFFCNSCKIGISFPL